MHHAGLSCRRTSQLVTLLAEPVSHNPITAWYRRAGDLFRAEPVRYHEELVVDETSLHIEDPEENEDGEGDEDEDEDGDGLLAVFLWAAIDPATGEVVHVAVAEGRGGVEARGFLQGVLRRCRNRPRVHVDRGVWYPWPLRYLGLPWSQTSGGVRNHVETWFGVLKGRLDAFRRRWPRNASREGVEAWVRGSAVVWNRDPEATCEHCRARPPAVPRDAGVPDPSRPTR
jgi:transposase-like protein